MTAISKFLLICRYRVWLRLFSAASIAVAASLLGASAWLALGASSEAPDPPDILWFASHEGGDLSEWRLDGAGEIFANGTGNATPSTTVARGGHYSVALSVTASDGGKHAVRLFRWAGGQQRKEVYYSVWYYFPQSYRPNSWWNVFQWKSKLSETVDDPVWILNVGNRPAGEMYFYLYDPMNDRGYNQSVKDIPVGQWFQVVGYYRQATDETGRVTIWQDGAKILDVSGVPTRRPGDQIHWSVNSYTDGITPSTATIYVDDAMISTTDPLSDRACSAFPPLASGALQFVSSFQVMAGLLQGRAGDPLENEHLDPDSGDCLQQTTTGLLVWRKADHWTAFTDGATTWINGPDGLQSRPNGASLAWESGSRP